MPRVPLTTSTKTQITNRRTQVAKYYLNRMHQTEIAAILDVTQATISNDIKALNKKWAEESQADISEQKSRELAELDLMELEAVVMYQKYKKENNSKEANKWYKSRLDTKKMRADILGLMHPQKIELDANMKHSTQKSPEEMTDEELDKEIDDDLKKLLEAGLIPDTPTV